MQQLGLDSGKVKFDARRQLAGKLAAASRTKSRRWRNRRSILPAAMTSVGVGTVFFTLAIGSLASFAIGRMCIRYGWLLSNAVLLTYVIPASFLAIPFYRIMQIYGLTNNLWSVIAAEVTFATPYAIFISQQYGTKHSDRARRGGAGAGRCRRLRPAASVERVPLSVPVDEREFHVSLSSPTFLTGG
jgi:hypothetical protein